MPLPSTRRIYWLVWLLCLVVFTASLDRIADPPATKPAGVEANVSILSHGINGVAPQPCLWACYGASIFQSEHCWFGTGEMPESSHPDSSASIVHHATDPSPPGLRLLPS